MKTTLIKPLIFGAGTSGRQKYQKRLMKLRGTAVAVLMLVISVSSVRSGRIDFGGVVPATYGLGEFAPGSDNAVPDALTAADWNSIRVAHEAQRNAVIPNTNGYRAHNPGQQWQTEFDGCGFLIQPEKGDWRWGLGLHSYGFPGHEQIVGRPQSTKTDGQRITYGRENNLSEWFVNDSRGLEHGFTVARRPGGSETKASLQFVFSVVGNLRPVISSDGSGVRFVNEAGANILTYTELKVWDADGRTLPARFVATEQAFVLSVDEQGARYPITIDPIAQQAYLKASNTEAGDFFSSVAISGDTVVVGASGEDSAATGVDGNQSDNSAPGAGAAYVFVRSGSTWTQQAYLKASNTAAGDEFGSVAILGDTVVIGAPGEASAATGVDGNQADNSAPSAGAAYVFVRNGSTWSQQTYVKASNTGTFDLFGSSVATSGNTVVIGALGEASAATGVNGNQSDNSAENPGAAYIFAGLPAGPLQNISTRAGVLTGSEVLIGGFVIGGTVPKQVLIRAIGPSLANFGIAGSLQDPMLSLHDTSSEITNNDDWQSAANAGQIPMNLQPLDSRESAILITLTPGQYTAIVTGKAGTTGTGLVEIYDLNPSSSSQLINMSARGPVQTGDNVMIGGFVSAGNSKVLVRAIGPSLTQFGVAGALADPALRLFDSHGFMVGSNDNWQDAQQAAIEATGKAPTNDLESAILVTLPPGAYTAIVSGKNGGTGVGLVELFKQ